MTISEKVWQEYSQRLKSFVQSKVHDDSLSDDILQDVFLKMHTRLNSLKDETKMKSWLYQIA